MSERRRPLQRFLTAAFALLLIAGGVWFARERGLLDPDDHKLVHAALAEASDDHARAEAIIAVFDEQVARKRSGWRRHGPWRLGLPAYVEALGQIARGEPASEGAALAACWLVQNDRGPAAQAAILVLSEHHALDAPIEPLSRQPSEGARDLLARLIQDLPEEADRARAQLALAHWHLAVEEAAREADGILQLSNSEDQAERAFWSGGMELVTFAAGREPDAERSAAVELLADLRPRVDELFPADKAEEIHGLMTRHLDLGVGSVAPDIVGTDLEGREMRLSDFRGKVVLLDFWGDW